MSRTTTPVIAPNEGGDLSSETIGAIEQQTQALAAAQAAYSDGRDLANQLLGQAQAAGAFEEFSRTVRISKLEFVKKNKLYKDLSGMKSPHGAEKMRGTWEEFCDLLGRSVDQVDRDIENLKAFGEAALDGMSRMGIGYRELRQFRRLPADARTALIEVAEQGDKASLLDLAEQLIARQQAEKDKLTKDLQSAREDGEAKERLLKQRGELVDRLETKLERERVKTIDQKTDDWCKEIQSHGMAAAGRLLPLISVMREASGYFFERDEPVPALVREQLTAAVGGVVEECWAIAREFDLAVDLTRFAPPDYLVWRENYENPVE
jgi:hypothetical protein